MPPAITTPAAPAAPNTALFAQPGENFTQYEARVAGGNSGNAAPVITPATSSLPNGNVSTDPQTNITPNQYALAPGESIDAYTSRIAGLRSAAGMPTPQTNASGAPVNTQSAEDQVAQSLGYKSYSDATQQLTAPPTQSETDLYNNAYSAAGLDALQNTITGRQNDLAGAQNKINDNPWLDESSRVGRNNTVTTLANADIKNYQTEYTNKLKEVQDLVTREVADGTASTAANKAKLAALEAQAKALATEAAANTKADNTPPKTITGSKTGTTYQWNPTTQTFDPIITPTSTTPTTKPTTPTSKSFVFTPKQLTALQSQGLDSNSANGILADIHAGQSLESIRQQMKASNLNPGLLDSLMYYVDPKNNTPTKASTTKTTTTSTPVK
jgi:hypothetical protein